MQHVTRQGALALIALSLTVAGPALADTTVSYQSNGYTLNVTDKNSGVAQSTVDTMVSTFFTIYPEESRDFNPDASKTVNIILDPAYDGVAATANATETYSANYLKSNPADTDTVTHESMHIVQDYGQQNIPGWLVEGIADYARYRYGVNNAAAGWSLPAYQSGQNYTDSYRVTARFLVWIEEHHPGAVQRFDAALRGRSYTDQTWVQITGSTVDQNWASYIASPGI
ncbi:basic secretory family protein [Luteibacter aegosomaticola]|uniref:basic secretory family protein n=1 Tax=Luteibacter aegosomaticola TaxID=2911538 RepID=UPI001FF9400A|nr:basic secretory family protein [Luteibacter aegosomaticola]UPG91202.1 basic secretory family protein [Luteibacter aegosomaticola]